MVVDVSATGVYAPDELLALIETMTTPVDAGRFAALNNDAPTH